MKKGVLFWIAFIACTAIITNSFAQSSASLKGNVSYYHIKILKKQLRDTLTGILSLSAQKSIYVYDRNTNTQMKEKWVTDDDGQKHYFLKMPRTTDEIGRVFYKDFVNNQLISRELSNRMYYIVNDSIPKIDWEISSEEKKIGDLTCRKAIGDFRGRTYEVWYAPSIPISNGPWKLGGLPGLILEAKDTDGMVEMLVKSIHLPGEPTEEIKAPIWGEKAQSFKDFFIMTAKESAKRHQMAKGIVESLGSKEDGTSAQLTKTGTTDLEISLD